MKNHPLQGEAVIVAENMEMNRNAIADLIVSRLIIMDRHIISMANVTTDIIIVKDQTSDDACWKTNVNMDMDIIANWTDLTSISVVSVSTISEDTITNNIDRRHSAEEDSEIIKDLLSAVIMEKTDPAVIQLTSLQLKKKLAQSKNKFHLQL